MSLVAWSILVGATFAYRATRQTTLVLTSETPEVSVVLSPDGHIVAVADSDGTVSLWTIATGQIITLTGSTGRVRSVALSPDGRTLASGSRDRTVRLWALS